MTKRETVQCLNCKVKITIKIDFSEMVEHQKSCFGDDLKLGFDYVVCKLCGFSGKKLTQHLENKHTIKKEDYDGELVCEKSKKTYSDQNLKNGSWIAEKRAEGVDLSEFFKNNGKLASKSIMANPSERKRRQEQRAKTNKTDFMRQKASEAAKKTSSRRDIQLRRADVLKKWREQNPERFRKIFLKMTSYTTSKPEKFLVEFLNQHFVDCFKHNQQLMSDVFSMNKTNRKQADFVSESLKTIVEFDGILHFRNVEKWNQLGIVQARDLALEKYCLLNNYKLIRISWDAWERNKNCFSPEVEQKIISLINENPVGIYKIGNLYNKSLEVEVSK